MKKAFLLALALLAAAHGASAQISTGNVYGTVTDPSGAVLPGVAVTISGELGTRSTTSGSGGEFRFLGLDRGHYRLTLALTGFASLVREIDVVTGENVELTFTMAVGGVKETVTVTAESPLASTRKRGTSTTMTTEELERVPTARDPWAVLRNVPGVLTDRVNIAGNESGMQAAITAKGADNWDNTWSLDGLDITDMAAIGASKSYFDYGAFDEIHVTTGAADLKVQGGGVGIHLTTRRGTNAFRGSARALLTHDKLSSSNLPAELRDDLRLEGSDKADHVQQINDFGFELGGPILKDRLWFYGTWGRQDIRLVRLDQTSDRTAIPAYNLKLNWQATPGTMVSAFHFKADKLVWGRKVLPGANQSDSVLADQHNAATPDGLPGGLSKLQVDRTFSPNLFVSAIVSYYDAGFGLYPRGSGEQSFTVDYTRNEALGTSFEYRALRPAATARGDGSYFFHGLGGSHELKFGFGYRNATVTSSTSYPGPQISGEIYSPTDTVAQLHRDDTVSYRGRYWSAYLGDLFSRGRLSVNLGLRWDEQGSRNLPGEARANASLPDVLPAARWEGNAQDLVNWSEVSPRAGLSLALDEAHKTVARASYAWYAQQLPAWYAFNESPGLTGYLAYAWNDRNGDRLVQPNEVLLDQYLYSYGVDPANPSAVEEPANRQDRKIRPKRDHEVVVGIDRELAPSLSAGLAYTWRRSRDWYWWPRLGGPCAGEPTADTCPVMGPEDYMRNAPVTANGYTAYTYSPDPGLVDAAGGGRLWSNQPGYWQSYQGLELTLTKRLARRWMGRLAFSRNDWTEHFDGQPFTFYGSPGPTAWSPLVDGGQVAWGGKTGIFTSVEWQLSVNAMVQLPWRFELAASLFGRQGAPRPTFLSLPAGRDGRLPALAQPRVDVDRLDDVWDLDLRLAKDVRVSRANLTLSVELFNVLNSGVVLTRTLDARSSVYGRAEEILAPRILRLGARVSF